MDTVWQRLAAFFIPVLVYWGTTLDSSSMGDLWTIAVVILVNLHLAMDVIRLTWITHAAIWGSIIATFICVTVIDAFPSLVGYWAIFHVAKTRLFWLCLLGIVVVALLPRFVVNFFYQYYSPCDVQTAREVEKFGSLRELGAARKEMDPILQHSHR